MTRSKGGAPEGARGSGTLIIIGGHEDHEGEREILSEVARHVRNRRLVLATIAPQEPEGCLEKDQAASPTWARGR